LKATSIRQTNKVIEAPMDLYTSIGVFFVRILLDQRIKSVRIDKPGGLNSQGDPVGKGKNPYLVNSVSLTPYLLYKADITESLNILKRFLSDQFVRD
jgi:hypothetical protein